MLKYGGSNESCAVGAVSCGGICHGHKLKCIQFPKDTCPIECNPAELRLLFNGATDLRIVDVVDVDAARRALGDAVICAEALDLALFSCDPSIPEQIRSHAVEDLEQRIGTDSVHEYVRSILFSVAPAHPMHLARMCEYCSHNELLKTAELLRTYNRLAEAISDVTRAWEFVSKPIEGEKVVAHLLGGGWIQRLAEGLYQGLDLTTYPLAADCSEEEKPVLSDWVESIYRLRAIRLCDEGIAYNAECDSEKVDLRPLGGRLPVRAFESADEWLMRWRQVVTAEIIEACEEAIAVQCHEGVSAILRGRVLEAVISEFATHGIYACGDSIGDSNDVRDVICAVACSVSHRILEGNVDESNLSAAIRESFHSISRGSWLPYGQWLSRVVSRGLRVVITTHTLTDLVDLGHRALQMPRALVERVWTEIRRRRPGNTGVRA